MQTLMSAILFLTSQSPETEKLESSWGTRASFAVYSLAFSPDGKSLAAGGREQSIALFDTSNGALRKTFSPPKDAPKETITGLGFTANSNILVSAGYDGMVRQWDSRSGKEVKHHSLGPSDGALEVSGRTYDFRMSPDGRTGAAGLLENIVVLKAPGLELSARLQGHPAAAVTAFQSVGGLHGLSFSRDGSRLASAGNDGTLKVWDLKAGKELRAIKAKRDAPDIVALSADGKLIASAGDARTVNVWEVQTGKLLMTAEHAEGGPHGVAFSPSGRTVVSADSKTLKVWEIASGKELASAPTQTGVDFLAVSLDGALIGLSNIPEGSIRVYRWIGPKTATEDKK